MNHSIIRRILGQVMRFMGVFLLLPCLISLIYHDHEGIWYLITAAGSFLVGTLLTLRKAKSDVYYAREGFVAVALSWILLSAIGALPFVLCGDIPSYTDALFETISGFTTTGSSILFDVEAMSHTSLFWRSFTHWVGGMGVIVFILAILPMAGGSNMHLMRAESPGYDVGKLVPRMRKSATLLYSIYFGMTMLQIVLLLLLRMPWFDTLCITFGTAGTGGFGIRAASCGDYTAAQQWVITIFMIAFGVNFNFYYYLIARQAKAAFKMSEVKGYLLIILFAIVTITINIRGYFPSIFTSIRHAAFQVGSIITTTGYGTTDFDLWPSYSKGMLVLLMFIGACAGSTGGGIKVSRVMILWRSMKNELKQYVHPHAVTSVKMDGKSVSREHVHSVQVYLGVYVIVFVLSVMLVLAFDHQGLVTSFTAVAATFNNIGPGLAGVGPVKSFGGLSVITKYVLMFDMLAGRLELYPMLLLLTPAVWKKN